MQESTVHVNIVPGGMPIVLHISQDDVGLRQYVFTPYSTQGTWSDVSGASVTLEATKPDNHAIVHNCTYNNDGTITYTVQEQLAAVVGRVWSKLVVRDTSDNVVAFAAIIWIVDPAGVTDSAIVSDSDISALQEFLAEFGSINAYKADLDSLRSLATGVNVAATKAAMTNHNIAYVYTGSESGMVTYNWYWYNGSDWVSGGAWEASVATDTTLTTSGKAADAKATGDAIAELKSEIVDNVNGIQTARLLANWVNGGISWGNTQHTALSINSAQNYRVASTDVISFDHDVIFNIATGYRLVYLTKLNGVFQDNGYKTGTLSIPAGTEFCIAIAKTTESSAVADIAEFTSKVAFETPAKTTEELFDDLFSEHESFTLEIGTLNSGIPSSSTIYVRTKNFTHANKGDILRLSPTAFKISYSAIYKYTTPGNDGYYGSYAFPNVVVGNSSVYVFTEECYFKFRAAKNDGATVSSSDLPDFEDSYILKHYYSHNDFEPASHVYELSIDYDAYASAMAGKTNIAIQTDTHMSKFPAYHNSGQDYLPSDFATFDRVVKTIGKLGCDCFANLGDIVRGYEFDIDFETRESADYIVKTYSDAITYNKFFLIGNHDDGRLYYHGAYDDKKSVADVMYPTEQFNRYTKYGVNNANTKNYYYKDINGVRFITLYQNDFNYSTTIPTSNDFCIGSDQRTWLQNTALNTSLPVVVLTHAPLLSDLFALSGTGFSETLTILNTFVSGGGTIIAVLSGHTHEQNAKKVDGINHIVFKNGYYFFELVSLDLTNRTITCTVVNRGDLSNRSFTY